MVIEFGGSNIETNVNLSGVSAIFNGFCNEFKAVDFILDLWGTKATLITNISG